MYASLSLIVLIEHRKHTGKTTHSLLIACIPPLWGLILEVLQAVLPFNRHFSWYDAAFNFLGGLLAWWSMSRLWPALKRNF